MDHKSLRTTALLLAALSIAGTLSCTTSRTPSETGPPTACFDAGRARSFSPLDTRHIYVRVGSDEHYLLTLDSVYTALPFASGISISGTFSRVCSDSGAAVLFVDSGRQVSARIISVESVASREAAQTLVDQRQHGH